MYSNEAFAALGYEGFYASEEEALRTSRVRAFRRYVTYLMDKRFTLARKPQMHRWKHPLHRPLTPARPRPAAHASERASRSPRPCRTL